MKAADATDNDPEFEKFWANFRMFPSRLERAIFRPFPLMGLIFLPYVVLVAGSVILDLANRTGWYWTSSSIREWQEIVLSVGLILITVPYFRWQSQIPALFQSLWKSHRLRSKSAGLKESYRNYLDEYQAMLLGGKGRHRFVILFCCLTVVFILVARIPQTILHYLDFHPPYAFGLVVVWIFGFLLWAVLAGLAAWTVYATGRQIAQLRTRFDIQVQPSHPDGCGGLKSLGDFCLSMSLPVILGGLLLALFGIGGIVLKDVSVSIINFNQIRADTVVFANVGLFVIFLPFTAFAFFLPLWNIHREMVAQKRKSEDEFADQIMGLEKLIRSCVDEEGGLENAKIAKEKLEIMQVVNPNKIGYPVWPFKYRILLTVFSPQLLGIVSTLFGLYQQIAAALAR